MRRSVAVLAVVLGTSLGMIGQAVAQITANGGWVRQNYAGSIANAVPLAYGLVSSSGGVFHVGTGNWSVEKGPSGEDANAYRLTVPGHTLSSNQYAIIVQSWEAAPTPELAVAGSDGTGILIHFFNPTSGTPTTPINTAWQFVLYRQTTTDPAASASAAEEVAPGLIKYNYDIEAWEENDPEDFEAYREYSVRMQREALRKQENH